jgi:hypothetical protein
MEKFDTKNMITAADFDIMEFDIQTIESEDTVGLPELAASIGEIGCCTVTIKPSGQ